MKARVIVTTGSGDVIATGAQLTRDVLVAAAREHDGYRGYVALYDAERGVGMAVTLWSDEQTERASELAIRDSREASARALGLDLRVDTYDVAVAEVLPG